MADDKPTYYITTPIYYVNDVPHIGHAYTTLACDVLARFMRLDGKKVHFLTGTDEHGQKVEKSAAAHGMTPQAFTDKVSQSFRDLAKAMNFSNDDFIRTTEPRHKAACQALWKKLAASKAPDGQDNIYKDKYAGWYSVRDEAFYGEDEMRDGPDGKKIAIASGAECEWVEEESYFFRLSAWQERLLAFYDEHPDFIAPTSRRNEVISFVKGGRELVKGSLRDLSISRTTFKWGVPVPGDDAHIMYVWLDALTNYISALGYPNTDAEPFKTFWAADLHVVGKDILRFHAVYWPAFLMAAGIELPRRIFANGWWTVDGDKMSKSLGNVISPLSLIETYGLDQTRYFLMREFSFGSDGDFSHSQLIRRINSELANGYGNLVQRVLSMIAKNCGGMVPDRTDIKGFEAELWYRWVPNDLEMLVKASRLRRQMASEMDCQAIHKAYDVMGVMIDLANGYIDEQAPWKLSKTDPARMQTVLYVLAEVIRNIAILTQPFMPDASAKILDQLAIPADERSFAFLTPDHALKPGTPLPAPSGVFPRYVEAAADVAP